MTERNTKPNRYEELDALRGIAAMMVVFFHFTLIRSESQFVLKLGVTGVDLFFIISGFVIFMSLTKVKSSLEFVINRISRLYPTYWTVVTFTFILIVIKAAYKNDSFLPDGFIAYLGNMTMFQYYLNIKDLDGPYWTMIIEMIFYVGIIVLFHFKILKHLNIIGITLSVVVAVMAIFHTYVPFIKSVLANPLLPFISLFFAGTVFYNIHENRGKLLSNYAIILVCLICQILCFNLEAKSSIYINHYEYALMIMIYFSLFVLFVNGKLKLIVSKPTLFLGKISYPLYLIHQYISIHMIIPFLTKSLHVNYWIACVFITLPVVIILASFITFYIEIPMRKLMKAKLCLITLNNSGIKS